MRDERNISGLPSYIGLNIQIRNTDKHGYPVGELNILSN